MSALTEGLVSTTVITEKMQELSVSSKVTSLNHIHYESYN